MLKLSKNTFPTSPRLPPRERVWWGSPSRPLPLLPKCWDYSVHHCTQLKTIFNIKDICWDFQIIHLTLRLKKLIIIISCHLILQQNLILSDDCNSKSVLVNTKGNLLINLTALSNEPIYYILSHCYLRMVVFLLTEKIILRIAI
jgi:hypothetical protein